MGYRKDRGVHSVCCVLDQADCFSQISLKDREWPGRERKRKGIKLRGANEDSILTPSVGGRSSYLDQIQAGDQAQVQIPSMLSKPVSWQRW